MIHGADVDGRSSSDQTPLHRASWFGRLEAAQCLLDRGADIDAPEKISWTPLFVVALEGHVELTRMLLQRGAEWKECRPSWMGVPAARSRICEHPRVLL